MALPEVRRILARWTQAAQIETEIAAVRAVAAGESGRFTELLEPRFRRPLIIAIGIAAIAQLSGINAIMFYSTRIFMAAGVGVGNSFTATVLVGMVNLLFTLVAVALMDRAGRRRLLLFGLAAQVLSLSVVAAMLAGHSNGLGIFLAVLIFIAAFAMSLGPISWLLGPEVFPAKVRGRAMSLVAFTTWVCCYIVAQTFPILNDSAAIGPAKTFWIYAVVSLVGLVFTFLLVPETKGRTLEEIEASWT
jgi:SP family arabinose:H+ symporter-like MFS transporter